MQTAIKTTLSVLLLSLPVFGQLTLPHVVDGGIGGGGAWQSTVVLTNMSANPATATLIFHKETGGGKTGPWTPTFQEVISTAGLSLVGGSVIYLHTTGNATDPLSQGWAELNADAGVTGYVVFTLTVPGRPNQEGTAPAVTASNRVLIPYDDSNGFVTGIAITNPTGTDQNLTVGFRNSAGVSINNLPTVPAGGHVSFTLSQQFPIILGHEGLAEFYSATGNISMIALRFNPTASFTAAPVYQQSGAPVITASTDPSAPSDPYTDPGTPPYSFYQAPRPSSSH